MRPRAQGPERARDEGAGDGHLPLRARERRGCVERVRRIEQPRNRRDAGQSDPHSAVDARRRDADLRERPLLPVHGLQVDARLGRRHVDIEDQLARLQPDDVAVALVRHAVELEERKFPARRADACVEREQRHRNVGGMRRRAEVVREDRMLAMFALARMATVAAVQPARILQPPVPAARRLEKVAAERSHVSQLRRRSEAACFA
jgi:hypothetical protein